MPEATAPTGPAAISVENVSKTFRLPHQQYSTLKERALHPFRSTEYDELHAVNDISLEIAQGEFFGIVGRNGSGKSTLLKVPSGDLRRRHRPDLDRRPAVSVYRAGRRVQHGSDGA